MLGDLCSSRDAAWGEHGGLAHGRQRHGRWLRGEYVHEFFWFILTFVGHNTPHNRFALLLGVRIGPLIYGGMDVAWARAFIPNDLFLSMNSTEGEKREAKSFWKCMGKNAAHAPVLYQLRQSLLAE